MSATSSIEWTEATWNPVTGCTKVSPGCDHCYAETFAERFRGTPGHHFERGFDVQLRPDKLDLPIRWRKPRRIFVNSMSDLFHKDIPDEYIAHVFAVMAVAQRHTFQLLTKRHARMRSLLSDERFQASVRSARSNRVEVDDRFSDAARFRHDITWPLPNVWLGVSVEDQQWADIRIPALLATPAAVRWISAEPLLGPVNLWRWIDPSDPDAECLTHGTEEFSRLDGHDVVHYCGKDCPEEGCDDQGAETGEWCDGPIRPYGRLNWIVAGGESGPGARPMHPDWARTIRDQCRAASVPFLFKQWGAHDAAGRRVGKGKAGRDLDGCLHDGYPDGSERSARQLATT